MYSCLSGRLAAQDQDQEVKEAAISGIAALVARLGDVLSAEVREGDLYVGGGAGRGLEGGVGVGGVERGAG